MIPLARIPKDCENYNCITLLEKAVENSHSSEKYNIEDHLKNLRFRFKFWNRKLPTEPYSAISTNEIQSSLRAILCFMDYK